MLGVEVLRHQDVFWKSLVPRNMSASVPGECEQRVTREQGQRDNITSGNCGATVRKGVGWEIKLWVHQAGSSCRNAVTSYFAILVTVKN